MKKITKVLATTIAVVTASIFLTGCGSGSAGNTVNAAAKDGAANSAGDDSKAAGAKKGTSEISVFDILNNFVCLCLFYGVLNIIVPILFYQVDKSIDRKCIMLHRNRECRFYLRRI